MKLSVIVPCHNGADTVRRAVDSILMQRVAFDCEIMLVDDGSTDGTADIFREYAEAHGRVAVVSNAVNIGLSASLAKAFAQSRGEYACVLDADDAYTVCDKLQKQVDFLDSDASCEYVGVAHYYIARCKQGINIPGQDFESEFGCMDVLDCRSGYYHASTYMYRNIFRGTASDVFGEIGDSDVIRTILHLMHSKRKIKVLNFVGSVYTYMHKGMWSSLTKKQQAMDAIAHFEKLGDMLDADRECGRSAIGRFVSYYEQFLDAEDGDDLVSLPSIGLDACVDSVEAYIDRFLQTAGHRISDGLYHSEYIDTLAATLGNCRRHACSAEPMPGANEAPSDCLWPEMPIAGQPISASQEGGVCVIVPGDAGISLAGVCRSIARAHEGDSVTFICSGRGISASDAMALGIGSAHKTIFAPQGCDSPTEFLCREFMRIAPRRTYCVIAEKGFASQCIASCGCGETIGLVCGEPHFLCGISNPVFDAILACDTHGEDAFFRSHALQAGGLGDISKSPELFPGRDWPLKFPMEQAGAQPS